MLAKNLKNILSQKINDMGISVSALEKKAGLSANSLRNILKGSSQNPSIETILAISKVLQISLDDLTGSNLSSSLSGINKLSKHEWNPILYKEATVSVIDQALLINPKTSIEEVMYLIEETYIYSLEKNKKIDNSFVNWLVKKTLSNKNPL